MSFNIKFELKLISLDEHNLEFGDKKIIRIFNCLVYGVKVGDAKLITYKNSNNKYETDWYIVLIHNSEVYIYYYYSITSNDMNYNQKGSGLIKWIKLTEEEYSNNINYEKLNLKPVFKNVMETFNIKYNIHSKSNYKIYLNINNNFDDNDDSIDDDNDNDNDNNNNNDNDNDNDNDDDDNNNNNNNNK